MLFTIGSSTTFADAKNRTGTKKSECLKYRLSKVILPSRDKASEVSEVTAEIFDVLGSLVGDEAGVLLLDKNVDLSMLNRIKKYGKSLVRMAKTETDRQVGWVIYYAAISNALVFRHSKITKIAYKPILHVCNELRKKKWVTPEIQRLLKSACICCQEHIKRGHL